MSDGRTYTKDKGQGWPPDSWENDGEPDRCRVQRVAWIAPHRAVHLFSIVFLYLYLYLTDDIENIFTISELRPASWEGGTVGARKDSPFPRSNIWDDRGGNDRGS